MPALQRPGRSKPPAVWAVLAFPSGRRGRRVLRGHLPFTQPRRRCRSAAGQQRCRQGVQSRGKGGGRLQGEDEQVGALGSPPLARGCARTYLRAPSWNAQGSSRQPGLVGRLGGQAGLLERTGCPPSHGPSISGTWQLMLVCSRASAWKLSPFRRGRAALPESIGALVDRRHSPPPRLQRCLSAAVIVARHATDRNEPSMLPVQTQAVTSCRHHQRRCSRAWMPQPRPRRCRRCAVRCACGASAPHAIRPRRRCSGSSRCCSSTK